ncbi:hypothetical protein PPTG_23538 [Phytophthora nicotianae INRA-310]|uniref:Uncharacterized protein n=1 Tax=Phytophthora nicotianae (strain INRA-310) TaxID=761204 RepID=W2PXU4_PHYN3|nr:hypothetical protein PPTG_23538 [Phytophthora nicotianae INRA-310]ETN05099.1 hypothetical protein PPTG_23538 [Phytophthora nicotianae INRA-310]
MARSIVNPSVDRTTGKLSEIRQKFNKETTHAHHHLRSAIINSAFSKQTFCTLSFYEKVHVIEESHHLPVSSLWSMFTLRIRCPAMKIYVTK